MSEMTFVCEGVRYAAGDLIAFATGAAHTPFVYLTRDDAAVFVATLDRWAGFDVHRAGAGEIEDLAARFGIADLRRALH